MEAFYAGDRSIGAIIGLTHPRGHGRDGVSDSSGQVDSSGRAAVAATRFRAAELAAEVGISVQLLRSYQSKGLLPPPRHEGRVAWYGAHHRERLLRIRQLKERGFSLRMIAEALDDRPEGGLTVLDGQEVLRLHEVAERSGVPVEVLRALEASGLLRPHRLAAGDRYTDADVRFVRNVLALLGVGLSLDDLMRIARRQLETSDTLGRDVVAAWSALVGTRLRAARGGTDGATHAGRVAASIRALAAIVGQLVAYRVERAVLDAAQAEIVEEGTSAELDALGRTLGVGSPSDGIDGAGPGSSSVPG
ncbi:MAG TPA: MerR family transcriptional regulator [Acidimicrobiales bacterium]|nr:MerR family transcriptional regulator [Acidimicrobiales bacterium]